MQLGSVIQFLKVAGQAIAYAKQPPTFQPLCQLLVAAYAVVCLTSARHSLLD